MNLADPQGMATLRAALGKRILILDGAFGTMVQSLNLDEAAFRNSVLADHPGFLKGNNDLLNLTRPDIVEEIHRQYLDAGADIIETNTFSATTIAQADYQLEAYADAIALEGAKLARRAADAAMAANPLRLRWVAGAIGPTNKTLSLSPNVNDPGHRDVNFEQVRTAYRAQVIAMIAGGVDLLLIETVFDTLNAKAAIMAIFDAYDETGAAPPMLISGTITDLSGRTLSGQTVEAFWHSIRHADPLAVGLNCALGAAQMRPFLADLARVADRPILTYPNAGLPNAMAEYDETPETTAGHLEAWAKDGLVNIVGGCCGTTPAHIASIAARVEGLSPRAIPTLDTAMRLSGLEPFVLPA